MTDRPTDAAAGLSFRRCCSAEALWNGTVGTPPASQYAFRAVVAMLDYITWMMGPTEVVYIYICLKVYIYI